MVSPKNESGTIPAADTRTSRPRRELFEVIPPSLFRPLTGQGAPFHALVLGGIFDAVQSGGDLPDEKDILDVIGNCLESVQPLTDETLNEYEGEGAEKEDNDERQEDMDERLESGAGMNATADQLLTGGGNGEAGNAWAMRRALARRVMRYLIRHGWLRPRPTPEGRLQMSLPHYASQLLLLFLEMTEVSQASGRGPMFAISDLLREAARQHDELVQDKGTNNDNWTPVRERIAEAARQMRRHVSQLKKMQHNLDEDFQQAFLSSEKNFPGVWGGFLGAHRERFQSAYHQVRTSDHVSWFRPEVRRSIAALQRGYLSDPDTEEHLNYLLTRLEQMDIILDFIDQQRRDYIQTVHMGLSRYIRGERTPSMLLDSILRKLAAQDDPEGLLAGIIRVCQLEFRTVEWLEKIAPEVALTPPVAPVTAAERAQEKTRLLTRLLNAQRYSLTATEEKVREWLRGRPGCHLSELPLETRDDLIWLLFVHRHARRSRAYLLHPMAELVDRPTVMFREGWLEMRKA